MVISLVYRGYSQDSHTHCFWYNRRQTLRGLTKTLTSRLWPTYSYSKAIRNTEEKIDVEMKESSSTGRKQNALVYGTLVHRQISQCIISREVPSDAEPYVRRFFIGSLQRGLNPVATEIIVGSARHGIATRMDVLFQHSQTKQFFPGEIKTGCLSYYNCHTNSFLPSPFQSFSDSPATQHQMQLTATRWMFEQNYPELKEQIGGAYVIVISGDTVQWFPQNEEIYKEADALMTLLNVRSQPPMASKKKKRKKTPTKTKTRTKEKAKAKKKRKTKLYQPILTVS